MVQDLRAYGDTVLKQMDNRVPEKIQMSTSSVQYMPSENPNFEWRIRADIRSGVDMPLNSTTPHKMPSCYVELTWSD